MDSTTRTQQRNPPSAVVVPVSSRMASRADLAGEGSYGQEDSRDGVTTSLVLRSRAAAQARRRRPRRRLPGGSAWRPPAGGALASAGSAEERGVHPARDQHRDAEGPLRLGGERPG